MSRYLAIFLMFFALPALAQQDPYGRTITFNNEMTKEAQENVVMPNIPKIGVTDSNAAIMQKLQPIQGMVNQQIMIEKQSADAIRQQNTVTLDQYYEQNPNGGTIKLPEEQQEALQNMQKAGMAGTSAPALQGVVVPPPEMEEYEYMGRNVMRRKPPPPEPTDLTPAQRDAILQQFKKK
jgi:hypothetical protein